MTNADRLTTCGATRGHNTGAMHQSDPQTEEYTHTEYYGTCAMCEADLIDDQCPKCGTEAGAIDARVMERRGEESWEGDYERQV